MSTLDPAETLLRLMTVAYFRHREHARELDLLVAEHGWLGAFVGDTLSEHGQKIAEHARQLAQWEAQERKTAADLSAKAVAANLLRRRVDMEQQLLALVTRAVDAALVDAGLTEHIAEVKGGIVRHLRGA